jgi:hypothetical protein
MAEQLRRPFEKFVDSPYYSNKLSPRTFEKALVYECELVYFKVGAILFWHSQGKTKESHKISLRIDISMVSAWFWKTSNVVMWRV